MADRALLSINVLEEFKEWLKGNGFEIHDPKGNYEALRAKKGNKWVIVFFKIGAKEHLSIRNEDVKIVRQFIANRKERDHGRQGNSKNSFADYPRMGKIRP